MDIQTYQQEYQHFADWLVQTGNNELPPAIQAAMWQGWLAKTMTDKPLLTEGCVAGARLKCKSETQAKRPLHPKLAEYLKKEAEKLLATNKAA